MTLATSCPLLSTSFRWLLLTAASSPRSLLPLACSSCSWDLRGRSGENSCFVGAGGLPRRANASHACKRRGSSEGPGARL